MELKKKRKNQKNPRRQHTPPVQTELADHLLGRDIRTELVAARPSGLYELRPHDQSKAREAIERFALPPCGVVNFFSTHSGNRRRQLFSGHCLLLAKSR
jgi:hypothetical protein